MKKFLFLIAAVFLLPVLGGCYDSVGVPITSQDSVDLNVDEVVVLDLADVGDSKMFVVEMDSDSFSPSELKIKLGDVVSFRNVDTSPHWPASDIHPFHRNYSEFDSLKGISPGELWNFKFKRKGEFTMHDHLNPRVSGKIIVD